MDALSIPQPDDWHLHVRDGAALTSVLPHTARVFRRAIIMPNLKPPVTTVALAGAYRERILAARPPGSDFEPLMTLYLTDATAPAEIERARAAGFVHGVKWYPAGATTHAEAGVRDVARIHDVLAAMQEHDLPLLVHGESTAPQVDVFDREAHFIDHTLTDVVAAFPRLRIVLEHITTEYAVEFITAAGPRLGATITAHHLLYNRNAMFAGGLRPHYYCLPVLKREHHREALLDAATGGNPKFFLGTDSAPHAIGRKESACGCAGVYTAHAALELYAEAFEQAGRLARLAGFASHHGADFYGLPRNTKTLRLIKRDWQVPEDFALGDERLLPLRAGERLQWQVQELK